MLCEAAKRGCAEETGCGVRRLSTRISRKSKPDFAFHLKKSTVAAIPEGQAGPGHVILTRCGDRLMSRAASGGRPRTDPYSDHPRGEHIFASGDHRSRFPMTPPTATGGSEMGGAETRDPRG